MLNLTMSYLKSNFKCGGNVSFVVDYFFIKILEILKLVNVYQHVVGNQILDKVDRILNLIKLVY